MNYKKASQTRHASLACSSSAAPTRTCVRRCARREEGHGGGPLREYRNVPLLGWGEQYHVKSFVSRELMRLIEGRGGNRV